MPVPLALPVGLLVGLSLAWLARAELARSEVPLVLARPFLVALGLGLLVFAPVTGYFAALHGDWSYLYLVRWTRVPSALDLLGVLACGAAVPGGFALATPWAVQRRGPLLFQIGATTLALVLGTALLASTRLGLSATYAQFHGGFGGVPIGKSALGRGVLLSWIALAVAYAWSVWVLRGRRSPGSTC